MRLSTIFELLLIFLLVAFAAYGRVIDPNEVTKDNQKSVRAVSKNKQTNLGISTLSLKQATDNVNRYCTCNENICNCCRDFHIPLVRLQGPGCASLQYLQGDNLALQLSFGDNILTSTVVNGKSPKPVCVPLPGGFSKFCGRIYAIERDAKDHFKACLGLELQSATELEASLRVSCFRFGPEGLKLRPAEPLPEVEAEPTSEEDDDDDLFGLGSDDDEDDEEDYAPTANAVPNSSAAEEAEDEDDDEDVLGFGALFDIITGEDETSTKRPKVTTSPPLQFTIPLLARPTTPTPLEPHEPSISSDDAPNETGFDEVEQNDDVTEEPVKAEEDTSTEVEDQTEGSAEISDDLTPSAEVEDVTAEGTNKIAYTAKPNKNVPSNKVKKTTVAVTKKPSITAASINAIDNSSKKPAVKPVKGSENDDDDDDILGDDDDDDEDDDILGEDDDDKDDDDDDDDDKDDDDDDDDEIKGQNDHKHEDDEDEKAEDLDDLDDDDDDEEDAVLTALVDDGKGNKNKLSHLSSSAEEDDYSLGFTELLARKRSMRSGRQSKVMRL